MHVAGMMRVKDEARWITRAVDSLLQICETVFVFDDHSTDGTPEILATEYEPSRMRIYPSPFDGLEEARDKTWLAEKILAGRWDWVVCIDGDEVLPYSSAQFLLDALRCSSLHVSLSLPVWYLWDNENTVRWDGVYSRFTRQSVWHTSAGPVFEGRAKFGFHCSNVPASVRAEYQLIQTAPLLHYGYMDRKDRIRKFRWYNQHDPCNEAEDCYRHIVQGDVPAVPASRRLKHAGPLRLRPIQS